MTEDSICRDCVKRKYVVYEIHGNRHEANRCREDVAPEDAWEESDVKVLECSEFERVKKYKIPPYDRGKGDQLSKK